MRDYAVLLYHICYVDANNAHGGPAEWSTSIRRRRYDMPPPPLIRHAMPLFFFAATDAAPVIDIAAIRDTPLCWPLLAPAFTPCLRGDAAVTPRDMLFDITLLLRAL